MHTSPPCPVSNHLPLCWSFVVVYTMMLPPLRTAGSSFPPVLPPWGSPRSQTEQEPPRAHLSAHSLSISWCSKGPPFLSKTSQATGPQKKVSSPSPATPGAPGIPRRKTEQASLPAKVSAGIAKPRNFPPLLNGSRLSGESPDHQGLERKEERSEPALPSSTHPQAHSEQETKRNIGCTVLLLTQLMLLLSLLAPWLLLFKRPAKPLTQADWAAW